jgi:hypothetical protein
VASGGWIEENALGQFFKINLPPEKVAWQGRHIWTALAKRSGDSAFDETTPVVVLFPKRRRVSLAAAVQNIYRPISF